AATSNMMARIALILPPASARCRAPPRREHELWRRSAEPWKSVRRRAWDSVRLRSHGSQERLHVHTGPAAAGPRVPEATRITHLAAARPAGSEFAEGTGEGVVRRIRGRVSSHKEVAAEDE